MSVIKLLCYCLLALSLVACGGDGRQWHARDISGLMPVLSFELTGETGRPVAAEDYRGKVVMLFFGFTHCPHFCPATLSKLSQALDLLPAGERDEVRILFVSIDPARDSLEDIDTYTDNFAPEVFGLTASEARLRDFAKRYRTTFSYGEPDENGNYDVSHGLAVYVFDREGKARLMILEQQTVEQIATDLRQLLAVTP
ncbi:MAG: SCO family protein [Pseudomonadales bacterium]|nr:SCO family protein [Pseudomonadales bacterium]